MGLSGVSRSRQSAFEEHITVTTPSLETIPAGLCQCGCGGKTQIAAYTSRRDGCVKGLPWKHISGHANYLRLRKPPETEEFLVEGVPCKRIALTKGQFAIVDSTDYEWLAVYRWKAIAGRLGKFYAKRTVTRRNAKNHSVLMHREILGLQRGDERQGDHVNSRETLDNRRKNLRIATDLQNHHNMPKSKANTTGFKGVSRRADTSKFTAQIKVNGQVVYLGRTETPEEAAELYREAATRYFGEFARFE